MASEYEALLLSLELALKTTVLLLTIGIPIGYWLSDTRRQRFGKAFIEVVFTLPLVLPPTVLGFYFLLLFGEDARLGSFLLRHFDVRLVFSFQGMLVASVVYNLPFMIGPVKNAFLAIPFTTANASASLGKNPVVTFARIQLPLALKGIVTGGILTFAHTVGEFGVVMMIGGNIQGKTRVASVAIYDLVEQMNYSVAARYSLILVSVSFVLLVLLFWLVRSPKRT